MELVKGSEFVFHYAYLLYNKFDEHHLLFTQILNV